MEMEMGMKMKMKMKMDVSNSVRILVHVGRGNKEQQLLTKNHELLLLLHCTVREEGREMEKWPDRVLTKTH